MAPSYLIDKTATFKSTCDRPKRQGCGRDNLMFECSLSLIKSATWVSKMISEWNQLPVELRYLKDIEQFKSKLKTYYFKIAFDMI